MNVYTSMLTHTMLNNRLAITAAAHALRFPAHIYELASLSPSDGCVYPGSYVTCPRSLGQLLPLLRWSSPSHHLKAVRTPCRDSRCRQEPSLPVWPAHRRAPPRPLQVTRTRRAPTRTRRRQSSRENTLTCQYVVCVCACAVCARYPAVLMHDLLSLWGHGDLADYCLLTR